MSVVNMKASKTAPFADLLEGVSIEVMPRTAAKIEDFTKILPAGTRVYIAHIEGTPIQEMVDTAKRLAAGGFEVMPHFPARIMQNDAELKDWIDRYVSEAGVETALLLGGSPTKPLGALDSSIQLLETGYFDGFKRLHIAGHPEGNQDIDAKGATTNVDEALRWKQAYKDRSGAEMAIATQFAFAAKPVTDWAERLQAIGITMPIHVGVAGPAKLQTLIKFAIACGVGPSLGVLQKRAKDLTKLLKPFEPTEVLTDFAAYTAENPDSLIERVHVFPLGGINASAEFIRENS
ncbi:methylenetetrahydrofolate reductase [Maritimibacter sp. UBA3975]|uniref:methylenetetrahydrofolate reductase n=1 Tax=Maritimibacter sp. UBA3975 TaxID=1946833 RepID=UPI000C0B0333|nr:methylenetetrahydrofolate reductase [Maritimibacter sp. UBA3975]MAM63336.1 5,10-methylenetetrahydrofolate reductase [Maritimibacter sp.]|tara:strand:+ start:5717 stop:6589 length:873 start_codon:yes stop_codon:yes gene_type:complete